ncbi:mariner Mos1 transposase [Trichonephila clavipes]|nr:mariner Mos1 transposase [Trichonephila clavipes]
MKNTPTTTPTQQNYSPPNNARPQVAAAVKNYLETLIWEVLPHPPYSPDIAPSNYPLLRSMAHGLSQQHFTSYEDTKNFVDSWIAAKEEAFFLHGIRMLPEKRRNSGQ